MNTEPLALDFKSATLYAVRVVLHDADPERLNAALAKRMADAGSFFENEPVVVDASRVDALGLAYSAEVIRKDQLIQWAGGVVFAGALAGGLIKLIF
ncbi:hypothetical protein AD428_16725 [Achromobacter sp. DMS1]|nr:hypothetical protein AD428_16725 [Achromobacter sp. DMS1]